MDIRGTLSARSGTDTGAVGHLVVQVLATTLTVGVVVAGVTVVARASQYPGTGPAPGATFTVVAQESGQSGQARGVRAASPGLHGIAAAQGSGQRISVSVRPGRLKSKVTAKHRARSHRPAAWTVKVSDLRGGRKGWVLSAKARLRSGKPVPAGLFTVKSRCKPVVRNSAPGVTAGSRLGVATQPFVKRPVLCVKDRQRGPAFSTSGAYVVKVKVKANNARARKLAPRLVLRTRLR